MLSDGRLNGHGGGPVAPTSFASSRSDESLDVGLHKEVAWLGQVSFCRRLFMALRWFRKTETLGKKRDDLSGFYFRDFFFLLIVLFRVWMSFFFVIFFFISWYFGLRFCRIEKEFIMRSDHQIEWNPLKWFGCLAAPSQDNWLGNEVRGTQVW